MREDYLDKLGHLLERMTTEQVRQVLQFTQFIYEEQEPEGRESREDPEARYQQFSQWCEALGLDLGTLDGWGRDTNGRTVRTVTGDET